MKDFLKQSWKYIVSLMVGLIIGLLINIPSCNKSESKIEYIPVHDTVTISRDSIIYKTKIIYKETIDTFYVTKNNDTIITPELPIEHKEYKDTIKTDSTSAEIYIKYHGFAADLDTVGLVYNYFNKLETIILKPKKVGIVWAVGLGGGFGGNVNLNTGTVGYGPEIGLYGVVGIGGTIK